MGMDGVVGCRNSLEINNMKNSSHNKIYILFVPFLVFLSSIASAEELGNFKPTAIDIKPPEYRWISLMSSGFADTSILDDSPDGIRGMFYRLAFISNNDVFIRPTMRIDEIVYQDAGCCWNIQKSWDVNFNKLAKSGVKMPRPEISGVKSVEWLDTRMAKIKYGESECTISDIGKENIKVECEPAKAQ
jgi:hypothetical protein